MTLTTRTSHYRHLPGGIIVQEIHSSSTQTLADARENVQAFNTLAAGRKHACMVDMRVPYQMERSVREYYASPEATALCSAIAMVVRSPVARIIGNLFLAMNRPPVPVRMFTDDAEAVAWLRRLHSEPERT